MGDTEVARFESAGDVRTVSILEKEDGVLELLQVMAGPSSQIAYGDDKHNLRVLFGPASAPEMMEMVQRCTGQDIRTYLADEGHDLVDVMDLCDANGVVYTCVSIGPESGVKYFQV